MKFGFPHRTDPAKNLLVFDRAVIRVNSDSSLVTNYITSLPVAESRPCFPAAWWYPDRANGSPE